ncbi:MAG: hypothetical protein JW997_06435 [Actinobacteria bacterium]|nr:hypothetical protein [Actinomycetota bacterium]
MISNKIPLSDIENARKIRKLRSDLKKDLKSGKISIKEVFSEIRYYRSVMDMKVIEVVCSLPKTGRITALNILKKLKISTCKKINGLGSRQKEDFCNYFGLKKSLLIK